MLRFAVDISRNMRIVFEADRTARLTATCEFRPGDKVVLILGPYQGTPGIFLTLTQDVNWAEVREYGNRARRHPVVWLGADGP